MAPVPRLQGDPHRSKADVVHRRSRPVRQIGLPPDLRPLFWDVDFGRLRWQDDRDLIVGRVLAAGGWDAVRWIYRRLGPTELRQWLVRRQGAGLTPRQLRFWETVPHLPHRLVTAWLARPGRRVWDRRCHP